LKNARKQRLHQQTAGVAGYVAIDKSTSKVNLGSARFFR